jgi:hypothetical protein
MLELELWAIKMRFIQSFYTDTDLSSWKYLSEVNWTLSIEVNKASSVTNCET